MKNLLSLLLVVLLFNSCDIIDPEPDFPRDLTFETVYNGTGSGIEGFYSILSLSEYQNFWGQDPTFAIDFSAEMILVYISGQGPSNYFYEPSKVQELEDRILFDIRPLPCTSCTRDIVQKVVMVKTENIDKSLVGGLLP